MYLMANPSGLCQDLGRFLLRRVAADTGGQGVSTCRSSLRRFFICALAWYIH